MQRNIIIWVVVVVVILGGSYWAFKKSPAVNSNTTSASRYCGSDGVLTDTMPIQSHRSYCIKSNSSNIAFAANTPVSYSFSIVDDQGKTAKDFEITHTKQMHVIVVRKDLAYFAHVHPEYDSATGVFTLSNLTLPADGEYRIFADFAPTGTQKDSMGMPLGVTISEDVKTAGGYTPQPLGSEEKTKTFDGLQVMLGTHGTPTSGSESMLMFSLSQNGKPVTDLEPYLGALGHSVIVREGNLDFIHAHPMEALSAKQNGQIDFTVDFPEAGKYKVFTQFQRAGKVTTTDFVITVAQGSSSSMGGTSMPGMNH